MLTLVLLSSAFAHKPSFSDGRFDSMEAPYEVQDPSVSIVVYHEVSCEHPQLWMQLETQVGEPTYLQLGVPVIERLEDYRPSVAMLAPGLPPLDATGLPFDVPDGFGGIVFDTEDVNTPGDFYEPFTQTESWILVEEHVEVEADGQGYIVAWNPDGQTGKLWVATGEVEQFTQDDWSSFPIWLEKVQAFHETSDGTPLVTPEEIDCNAEATESNDVNKPKETRCSSLPSDGGAPWLWALAGLTALGRRMRTQETTDSR